MILAANVSEIDLRGRQLQVLSSNVSVTIWEMARLRNHLWLEGMTNHGAFLVLVVVMTSSKALT